MRLPNPARHCLRQLHQDCYFTAGDAVPGSRSRTAVPFERTYQLCSIECVVRSNDVSLGELVDRFLVPFRAGGKPTTTARTYVLDGDSPGAISLVVDGEVTVAGCEYLSDEVVLVDLESGMLHPFPPNWDVAEVDRLHPGLLERLPPELRPAPGCPLMALRWCPSFPPPNVLVFY